MFIQMLSAGMMLVAKPVAAEALPEVTGTHFLAIDTREPSFNPVETTRIPYRPDTSCYNWVLTVAPEDRAIAVREVFELPASAEQWGQDPTGVTAVSRDRTRAVTEIEETLDDGVLTHGWCVAEGDPIGPHRIRVFVGDQLLHDFRFEVVAENY